MLLKILPALFIMTGSFSHAGMDESGIMGGLVMPVQVLSDTFNKDVPDGTFALRGHVKQMYGNEAIAAVLIANINENPFVITDSLGFFEMIFPISDTAIYCYKEGLTEAIFKGPFTNRHLIELNFYLQDPMVPVICAKPVIYAYNADAEVSISLKPKGGFTFTYPSYSDKWQITTGSDGMLTDVKTNKKYPYLFWEGHGENLDFIVDSEHAVDFMEGYLIKTDTCVAFLENVLSQIGLNEKEATDFITFWAPQMIVKDYALVQFFNNKMYEQFIAGIEITPLPLSLLRTYMYFTPLDSPDARVEIVAPIIEPFQRNGFTVVEWGGSVLSQLPTVQ